jgi:cytochrome c oxidase cbb3-type subunit 3
MRRSTGLALLCLSLAAAGCDREKRPFTEPADTTIEKADPYRDNAFGISEGKRLFSQYNCSGCHANGGGGIGPALMDDEWRYGFEARDIFATISGGRPNGMPAFKDKVTEDQIWQLTAYVLSMSGQARLDVLPGRSDHLRSRTAENLTPAAERRQTGHK